MCFALSYVLHASCHLILNANLWGRNYYISTFYLWKTKAERIKVNRSMIWAPLFDSWSLDSLQYIGVTPEKLQVHSRKWQWGNRPGGTGKKSTALSKEGSQYSAPAKRYHVGMQSQCTDPIFQLRTRSSGRSSNSYSITKQANSRAPTSMILYAFKTKRAWKECKMSWESLQKTVPR